MDLIVKVKLHLYRRFLGKREFKRYLHGHSDEGPRLLFKGAIVRVVRVRTGSVKQHVSCSLSFR